MDRGDNGYRLCVLGDLNGCIGDRVKAGISGVFGVPGENDTLSTRVCISKQEAKGQDIVEVKTMTDLVLVKKDIVHYVQDVGIERGMGRGFLEHHVVL